MIEIKIPFLNLDDISSSGQCFRWEKLPSGEYSIISSEKRIYVSQDGDVLHFDCSGEEFDGYWYNYFDIGSDYAAMRSLALEDDAYLKKSMDYGSGIRILRQDLWEMIITFIISQRNNMVRIRKCIDFLCKKYGRAMTDCRGRKYYAFPEPEILSQATDADLRSCNVGYRSRYIKQTAIDIAEGVFSLEDISRMDYASARKELLKIYGVGNKVADCICLFSLHHMEAFPVDTHIGQILEKYYPNGFPFEKYGPYAGLFQQYEFFYKTSKAGS